MSQPARFSRPINNPDTQKHRLSQHDSAAQNFPDKCLIFYHVHIRSVFPGFYVKNIAYIADPKTSRGGGGGVPQRRISQWRMATAKSGGVSR